MTTFQDPPPQSRRAARQGARPDAPTGFGQFPPTPVEAQSFLPQQPPVSPTETGRRARQAPAQGLYEVPAEPLSYMTQGRQPAAPYGAPVAPSIQSSPQSSPQADAAPYRVRDFSPEASGRRAAAPPLVEPTAYSQPGYPSAAAPSDLDYRTQGAPSAYPGGYPGAPVESQTLSRREVRQRLEAEAAQAATAGLAQPMAYSQPIAPLAPQYAQPQYTGPQPAAFQPGPVASAAPEAPARARRAAPPAPDSVPAPPTALSNAMAEFEALTRTAPPPVAPAPREDTVTPTFIEPSVEQTGGWTPPAGHWSRQADLDDETQPWESTITREVGGGNVATTTNALVLPEIPRLDPFATALNSTGEILLTGSIDLPRSLGSTGGDSRHYDDPIVDTMFDTHDGEYTGTNSSPVRAIRAVSTHTSARGVIHANKPHGNRMLVVVFVATAVLAVGVVGMLAAGLAFGLF